MTGVSGGNPSWNRVVAASSGLGRNARIAPFAAGAGPRPTFCCGRGAIAGPDGVGVATGGAGGRAGDRRGIGVAGEHMGQAGPQRRLDEALRRALATAGAGAQVVAEDAELDAGHGKNIDNSARA